MSTFQKIIKYLAMAFAISLIVSIISGICYGIGSVSFIFASDTEDITKEFESFSGANALYADLDGAELVIKQGDTLKAEADSEYISCRQDGNRILITEKSHRLFGRNNKSRKVTVYIPENLVFDEAEISVGAGKVTAETINSKKLSLDIGAGEMIIDSLNVTDEAEIDGGAGSIKIADGSITNLDADTGMGEFILCARLSGSSEIDHGIGEADISLVGDESDYTITINKGIGEATLDGKSVSSGDYGNGASSIDIDCGIGEINVGFVE